MQQLLMLVLPLIGVVTSQGYYWRDFNGKIPDDAFPVVRCKKNNTYIGRGAVTGKGVFIGNIYDGGNKANLTVAVDGKSETVSSFIQILCTDGKQAPKWTLTDSDFIQDLAGTVEGGFIILPDGTIEESYIGKKGYSIGAVQRSDYNLNYLTFQDGKYYISDYYEVLIL